MTVQADGDFRFVHLIAFHRLPASIFQSTLTRDATAGYATEHVHCLTDELATSTSIRQAFADISAEAGAGCSVLVVFDMPTVEIQGGPEAGFYFCPHDYRCQCMPVNTAAAYRIPGRVLCRVLLSRATHVTTVMRTVVDLGCTLMKSWSGLAACAATPAPCSSPPSTSARSSTATPR